MRVGSKGNGSNANGKATITIGRVNRLSGRGRIRKLWLDRFLLKIFKKRRMRSLKGKEVYGTVEGQMFCKKKKRHGKLY